MSTLLLRAATAALGVALDRLCGEVPRAHPLIGFGRLAGGLEAALNRPSSGDLPRRLMGIGALLALIGLPTLLLAAVPRHPLFDALVLYFTLGWRSLGEHAAAVQAPLMAGDLPAARAAVSRMVSRDCAALDEAAVAAAAVESVLENGNDAVFGALFWFAVLGAPGALAYRLANTLDAMWGYRNERFLHFGWAAARLDDLLNLAPARATALAYALCGDARRALACWRTQAGAWKSPNAGPVMAAGAGALRVRLGGPARYHGAVENRPLLGAGQPATAADIGRARALVGRSLALWLAVLLALGLLAP
ncbi:adenosylcobinamide-phosphate synthase CbiB [Immundisolibacter sp.]|uniref:adenosylcobinamide-phosphate synthase CbiB n=1 Tax=Immundisolibacter sp. TaxID=1934948 RepID=UPI00260658B3|nr:adenosylcobinamide-phosphate synthase CbiB [Immundisolibacter sp.]MDD3651933.1 adenosylcobinamide-phosphate synthase CbiB [Immundisolibacter sp.]